MFDRKGSRQADDSLNISAKANLVLNIVIVAMFLIVLRIWHLSVIQYEERLDQSRKPQRRTFTEPAKRGTIRDRFNTPLAINKVQYNVSIQYAQLKQIPTTRWEKDPLGQSVKKYKRKEYIAFLSQILGKELGIDAERIEDLIHAKGPYYHQIPFLIKEDISEAEYYRLKMLEKDWLGIQVQRIPRRFYPYGRTAGDIIGYMGAINRQEYDAIFEEIKALETYIQAIDSGEMPDLPEGIQSDGEVIKRLKELKDHAYTINDSIGKTGIEGHFEEPLRGFHGKKSYYSDARGNFLRELPSSRDPLSGQRILLTLSLELQQYAEQLLIQNEQIRQTRVSTLDTIKRTFLAVKQPWIRGGAIVVLEPNSGDVLAMASYPRFDPNDFISSGNAEVMKTKRSNVMRWLESENYLAEIWDQKRPLEREIFDEGSETLQEEKLLMTWENYLQTILAPGSPIKDVLTHIKTIRKAIDLQKNVERVLAISGQGDLSTLFNILYQDPSHIPHGKKLSAFEKELLSNLLKLDPEAATLRRKIDSILGSLMHTYDQVLVMDLIRLVVAQDHFTDELLDKVGDQSLSFYRSASGAMATINEIVVKMSKELYHDLDFKNWRQQNEKEFLKQKRAEEKAVHKSPKPYLDYLDAKENEMFQHFWQQNRWKFIVAFLSGKSENATDSYFSHFLSWQKELANGAHQAVEWREAYYTLKKSIKNLSASLAETYLQTLRSFHDLKRPLFGKYRHLRRGNQQSSLEKHLAAAFYPKNGYGYGRSQAYRQATTQGSIFKLITAYEALIQRYHQLKEAGLDTSNLNPLEMTDKVYYKGNALYLGYNADGEPLPRFYKGGRLPKSTHSSLGKLDLIKAIETSSNPYFALLAGDILAKPQDLTNAAYQFSYGSKTGIELPGEISGSVPKDVENNRTGLYSLSIGQHTLVVTPLQTAVMLAAIANGGKILKPKIVRMAVGESHSQEDVFAKKKFPYQESLSLIGIDFPLFTEALGRSRKGAIAYTPNQTKNEVFMPQKIREILLEGMRRVVIKTKADSLGSLSKLYHNHPEAISDYLEMESQLIGKTSTSESMENLDLDLLQGTNIYTHVWFGGIYFDPENSETFLFKDAFGHPEVVVVVYLRYGGFGKEAAPLAAQIAKKWKDIKSQKN